MGQSWKENLIDECIERSQRDTHASYFHDFTTDEILKTRIAAEHIYASSCFRENLKTSDVVKTILSNEKIRAGVIAWLSTPEKHYRIKVMWSGCGKKFSTQKDHDWKKGAMRCDYAVLILVKNMDRYAGIHNIAVKTCYPE